METEPVMGAWLKLDARDGHTLSAYMARPSSESKGGLVIVQEIFGVNAYIRSVVDGFAEEGYTTIAPALFDRVEPGVELQYEGEDLQKAFGLYQKLNAETALLDVAAAFGKVNDPASGAGVLGYCYGGFVSWLSATRGADLGFMPKCCVGYYPGGIGSVAKEEPHCPVLLHFGSEDSHIGIDQVDAVRHAHPEVTITMYEKAEHGFSCDARASYNPDAAAKAREQSLKFLGEYIRR